MAATADQFLGTGKNHIAGTVTLTTAATVAAGGLVTLVVSAFNVSASTFSITTTGGLTWSKDVEFSSGNLRYAQFSAPAPTGLASGTALVATLSAGTSADLMICGQSFLGADTGASRVRAASSVNTGASTPWASGNVAGLSGDLLVGGAFVDGSVTTSTPSGGATEFGDQNDATQNETQVGGYKLSISGTDTIAGDWAANSSTWIAGAVAYKPASTGSQGGLAGATPTAFPLPEYPTFRQGEPTFPDPPGQSVVTGPDQSRYINPVLPPLSLGLALAPQPQTFPAPAGQEVVSGSEPSQWLNPLSPVLGLTLSTAQPPYFPPATTADVTVPLVIGTLILQSDAAIPLVAVPPTVGNLTLSAPAPAPQVAVPPTIGNLVLGAPAAVPLVAVPPSIGNLQLGSDAPTISVGGSPVTVSPTIANLILSADAPVVLAGLAAQIGNLVLSAPAPTLAQAQTPTIGNMQLTSAAPVTQVATPPSIGNLVLSAVGPNVGNRSISIPTANLILGADGPTLQGSSGPSVEQSVRQWLYFFH